MSFEVIEPVGRETPVVVEIPHASVVLDALSVGTLKVPSYCIGQDADLYVDDLYVDAVECGATVLVSKLSRYVCDLNRGEADIDDGAVQGAPLGGRPAPHGLVWRQSTDGQSALRSPLSQGEFERRLNTIYRPYHARLGELIAAKVDRFGVAVLLAAHSMPSSGRHGHIDTGSRRADVVPGSRGRSTAAPIVIQQPEELARARGWSVAHDDPYRGGFTTARYGRPGQCVHAVQVELNRHLYMNEETLEKLDGKFDATRQYCRELVARLAALPLEALGP